MGPTETGLLGGAISYIAQGFGVFLGVLAGTAVNFLGYRCIQRHQEKSQVRNLIFELDLDCKKIDHWLEQLRELRNAINGDCLDRWFGYFDFSRFIYLTANNMFQSGQLYKLLTHEQIEPLQEIVSTYTQNGEQFINTQANLHKQVFLESKGKPGGGEWAKGGKADAAQFVNFWETKLNEHRRQIEGMATSLRRN